MRRHLRILGKINAQKIQFVFYVWSRLTARFALHSRTRQYRPFFPSVNLAVLLIIWVCDPHIAKYFNFDTFHQCGILVTYMVIA